LSQPRKPSAIADRTLDSDRQIALSSFPWRLRPAFSALWAVDLAMADVVASSTEPALGVIRLAWWREALQRLDQSEPPAEPRLQAVADHLIPRGISGAELAKLEDCWLALLEPFPWTVMTAELVRVRGRILFGIGARLLGWEADDGEAAGALWSLVDVARYCSDYTSRRMLLDEARKAIGELGPRKPPRSLRPLTALAAVAAHDVFRNKPLDLGNSIGRGVVASVHLITGRLPRG
jgi:phytoene synthase